ncbi:MAG TPA: (Fe-S)-binding protein [Anaerolineaceae bacterium]|nr:(Fe-S)-binding protein [Anaerolineaceae bacterium]HPC05506.1 (Fe-S)-binding protein [Anaerolineaceae bacterium]HQN04499.1 (Fe-S)-binding protein [Anaerolineaceae bacterium]HQP07647.1 (Fe-S)-binding protein [Anaerolineaceae bacterium]
MNTISSIAMNTFVKETGGYVAAQLEACTRCGMCADACHFYVATGNPEYAPVWKIELLKRAYEQRFTLAGKVKLALGVDKAITDEEIQKFSKIVYEACTMCNKCSMVCPMGLQLGPLIHEVRTSMSNAGVVPDDLMKAVNKQVEEGSPLGVTDDVYDDRIEWVADEWEVDIPVDVKGADTLVVFSSIEVMKFPENIAAIAKILNTAGEKWTLSTSGREVVNFGFYEGNEELTKLFMQRVFDAAKELGVKKIVVTECGHAYDALRWTSYNMMEVPAGIEITHIVGLIGEYVRSGRIKLKAGAFDDGVITFHDACKIQRRGGHIKEPREILNILAPNSFKEMSPSKEQAICCGGGGGVIAIKEADPVRYAAFELKIDQMNAIGADAVVMSCSNCRLQFTDCVQHFNLNVKVKGLSQMVADALVEQEV